MCEVLRLLVLALPGIDLDADYLQSELSCDNEDNLVVAREREAVQNERHGFMLCWIGLAEGSISMRQGLVGMVGPDQKRGDNALPRDVWTDMREELFRAQFTIIRLYSCMASTCTTTSSSFPSHKSKLIYAILSSHQTTSLSQPLVELCQQCSLIATLYLQAFVLSFDVCNIVIYSLSLSHISQRHAPTS